MSNITECPQATDLVLKKVPIYVTVYVHVHDIVAITKQIWYQSM